jgi:TrpR family transcriptional regulator, trp operon repressor
MQNINLLTDAFLAVKSRKEMDNFLKGIMTPKEIEEFAKRIEIVKMLKSGITQLKITKKLKVGIATVTRGANEIKKGHFSSFYWRE